MEKPALIMFASTNRGKFAEVAAACRSRGIRALMPDDLAKEAAAGAVMSRISAPPQVEESACTYFENAKLKADAFFSWGGLPSLADDTGLEVQALGGRPGIHSARFAGEQGNMALNIKKLLETLERLEQQERVSRRARFVCTLVLAAGRAGWLSAEGSIEGEIAVEPSGAGGFGYDSVFIVDGFGATLSALKEKGVYVKTHRLAALENLFSQFDRLNPG